MDLRKPRKKISNDRKMALGYIRVSTDKQTKGLSLQNQKKTIRKYASLHNLHLQKIFSDNGSARKITSRPGLIDLLHTVKDKNLDAVIVYRLDRMFRNTKDALNIIEKFKRHGVAFHSFTEKIDTESPQGRFFLTILASFATMERELISERIKDVLKSKRERKELISGNPPYGYDVFEIKNRKGKTVRKLIENSKEQRRIRKMIKLYKKGLTYGQISDELKRLRYKTKTGNKNWHYMSVRKIVQRYS
jgi:site-specific DNA recombinase